MSSTDLEEKLAIWRENLLAQYRYFCSGQEDLPVAEEDTIRTRLFKNQYFIAEREIKLDSEINVGLVNMGFLFMAATWLDLTDHQVHNHLVVIKENEAGDPIGTGYVDCLHLGLAEIQANDFTEPDRALIERDLEHSSISGELNPVPLRDESTIDSGGHFVYLNSFVEGLAQLDLVEFLFARQLPNTGFGLNRMLQYQLRRAFYDTEKDLDSTRPFLSFQYEYMNCLAQENPEWFASRIPLFWEQSLLIPCRKMYLALKEVLHLPPEAFYNDPEAVHLLKRKNIKFLLESESKPQTRISRSIRFIPAPELRSSLQNDPTLTFRTLLILWRIANPPLNTPEMVRLLNYIDERPKPLAVVSEACDTIEILQWILATKDWRFCYIVLYTWRHPPPPTYVQRQMFRTLIEKNPHFLELYVALEYPSDLLTKSEFYYLFPQLQTKAAREVFIQRFPLSNISEVQDWEEQTSPLNHYEQTLAAPNTFDGTGFLLGITFIENLVQKRKSLPRILWGWLLFEIIICLFSSQIDIGRLLLPFLIQIGIIYYTYTPTPLEENIFQVGDWMKKSNIDPRSTFYWGQFRIGEIFYSNVHRDLLEYPIIKWEVESVEEA